MLLPLLVPTLSVGVPWLLLWLWAFLLLWLFLELAIAVAGFLSVRSGVLNKSTIRMDMCLSASLHKHLGGKSCMYFRFGTVPLSAIGMLA